MKTGTFHPASRKAADNVSCILQPFSCCRFGDSSMIPPRMIPGNPAPIASMIWPCASASISRRITCAIASAGIPSNASADEPCSGYIRREPCSRWFSTIPATTWSAVVTPMVRRIVSSFLVSLKFRQLIQSVKSGGLVAFRQGRIIENRIHKIVHRSAQDHHGLPDVQQLGRALANDVHAQHQLRLAMEDNLQPAGSIAANLPASDLPIIRHADLVWNILIRQLFFRLADK